MCVLLKIVFLFFKILRIYCEKVLRIWIWFKMCLYKFGIVLLWCRVWKNMDSIDNFFLILFVGVFRKFIFVVVIEKLRKKRKLRKIGFDFFFFCGF